MISVIIPVLNGEAYIAQAIESVLDQTLPADEVVVINDGSSDGTAEIVRGYQPRVLYHRQPNLGPGAARNLGIRESKGDQVAFLDADDRWLPNKLALQKAALDADPALDLVFSHTRQFLSPELSEEHAATLICDETVQPSPLISCLLARRETFERVGPFRTDIKAEFVEWYLRGLEAGLRMRILDVLLVERRIHTANFTLKNRDVRLEYLRLLKASLDRRRSRMSGNAAAGALA